ncbi:4'-phosphopantetheinyl transferase superfamily protein [Streptomyces sp. ACA25]|uniref:4'-phosphopantetheinyl transferase family protein n=1 Tax=Streptomyces sp. ACA25 TaxID=3022596 RepID=UPI002307DF68|nr:4'-phosphopantetheinyl transferase superfamily protein [Streptomyces sp. ACA25]MDB1086129.1 4'-phosphopantetheinyl transferase superfamily protein [Streptomyces sp. ACA25]
MDRAVIRVPGEFDPEVPTGRIPLPAVGEPPQLWLVRSGPQAAAVARLASEVLDAEEKRRAAAFRQSRDRDCYLAAHLALRRLLGACLGTAAGAVRLVREACPGCGEPHGRPAVAGGGVHFSLSHSGSLALLALAAVPVGVDVEAVPEAGTVADVAPQLHPAEVEELAALPGSGRPAAFARVWARKEAYLKGLGIGLGRSPAEDYVGTAESPAPGPDGWSLADVAVGPGHAGAVALRDR